ncbi:MAG: hypothetical protein WD425_05160, partial [Nitrospirales bacterium]
MVSIKTADVSKVKFSSTVFPSDADMKLWERLTPEQRKAVEVRDEEEGSKFSMLTRIGLCENT